MPAPAYFIIRVDYAEWANRAKDILPVENAHAHAAALAQLAPGDVLTICGKRTRGGKCLILAQAEFVRAVDRRARPERGYPNKALGLWPDYPGRPRDLQVHFRDARNFYDDLPLVFRHPGAVGEYAEYHRPLVFRHPGAVGEYVEYHRQRAEMPDFQDLPVHWAYSRRYRTPAAPLGH